MIVAAIDNGLEAMIRAELPLPVDVGDVSFDPPSGTWSAQLNRITVNVFLFGVSRSPQPPRPALDRPGPDNRIHRRPPLPMLQLNYLVTAWAGTVNDEHQLIGDVLTTFLLHGVIPAGHFSTPLEGAAQLAVAPYDNSRAKDVWSTVGGTIKPSFELIVTVPVDALPFQDLGPRVERIRSMVERRDRPTARATNGQSRPAS